MLKTTTIKEIESSVNTGVEYEIALFYALLPIEKEREQVADAINRRGDADKVWTIAERISTKKILKVLVDNNLTLVDCSFETQNDEIGPSDLVLYVRGEEGRESLVGLSVKYANQCTKNCTGMRFITVQQRTALEVELPIYTRMYIDEMKDRFGDVGNWFRKRLPSEVTDRYIDLLRDAVLANWVNLTNKEELFDALFQADSPIDYWVCEFKPSGRYELITQPVKVAHKDIPYISIAKYESAFIGFYLYGRMIAKMQVKFNNGFVESVYDHKGCRKRGQCDFVYEGVEMVYGKPFASWNFSVIR